MSNIRIPAITIGAAIILGLSAAAASAGTPKSLFVSDGVIKYLVRYPDLDLTKVDDASALYNRLRKAAATVCSPLESRDLTIAAPYRACVAHAIAEAVANVGSPTLSQFHESHIQGDKAAMAQLAKAN